MGFKFKGKFNDKIIEKILNFRDIDYILKDIIYESKTKINVKTIIKQFDNNIKNKLQGKSVQFNIKIFDSKDKNISIKERKFIEKNLIYENSPFNSSTGVGYGIESYIDNLYLGDKFDEKTNVSAFDVLIETDDFYLMINIKSEKDGKSSGVVAYSNLLHTLKTYIEKEKKPVYYLVYILEYTLDVKNNCIDIIGFRNYILNPILMHTIKTDNRSWSKNSKKLSGRIKVKYENMGEIPNINIFNNRLYDLLKLEEDMIIGTCCMQNCSYCK